MNLKENIESREKTVRLQLEYLRSTLNDWSKISKQNPNDWKYLMMLTTCEKALKSLNEDLEAIKQ
jgi:hypothetical protein